ncbi:hypothetical protein [Azospirillum sp. TSH100]|uniref:hypothetical protein n=1 Tax=Azospirillum sp. TSH100 TaxID=652764 RepID=UPI000D65A3E2|nr:hypothetical protein [Azospirillum sp. TSH100]QCG92303.1 hypothetical protein E6C72_31340 [Azospirillum sp. TSH100]
MAREVDRVSEGWGAELTKALASGDRAQIDVVLGTLSTVTLYHVRKRAARIDARLGNAAVPA